MQQAPASADGKTAASIASPSLLTAGGAAVVGLQAAHGRIGVGAFAMFLAAAGGTQSALMGTVSRAATLGTALRLLPHYSAVLKIGPDLAAPPGKAGRAVPALRQGITLADVWFRYGDDGPWVLRGVTAELQFGQATALVGGRGQRLGKEHLAKLWPGRRGRIPDSPVTRRAPARAH